MSQDHLPTPASMAQDTSAASSTSGSNQPTTGTPENEKQSVRPLANAVPNGGLTAWLQVAGGWMLFFNTWGLLNTFGIFQTYYEGGEIFQTTSSNISWIGAIQAFMVLVVGGFSGPVFDAGHLRLLLLSGSFLIVFGFMMTSLATTFWEVLLAQGFCIGIGGGLLFVPAVAIVPSYFTTKIGLAIGLVASGSSMGGVIYPIVFYKLIDQIGFGWTVRTLGFISLATLIIPIAVMKQRVRPPAKRALVDWASFKDFHYMLFVFATFLGFCGLYVYLFYISFFGESSRITDASLSFYLVPILNAGSVFGRTLPNWLSDKTGPLNMIWPGALIVSILIFCTIAVNSVAGIVVEALLFGFFSGIYIALPPVILASLTEDKSKIGTRVGMAFTMIAFSVLIGGPGTGAIIGPNENNENWKGAWIMGGVFTMASAVLLVWLRFLRGGAKIKVKV